MIELAASKKLNLKHLEACRLASLDEVMPSQACRI